METLKSLSGKKIELEIISPDRIVLQDSADYVVLPAKKGECAILPGHAHFLTELNGGELRVINDGEIRHLAVSGGFAQASPNKIQVFAETAEMAKEIDTDRANLAAERAQQKLRDKALPIDQIAIAQAELSRALIRLRVSANLKKKHPHRQPS